MNDYNYKMQSLFNSKINYPNQEKTKKDECNEIFILLA